jgi:hypothetical protein
MGARERIGAEIRVLATAKLAISTATTSNFNFGSPTDLKLNNLSLRSSDRIVIVFRATAAAATSNISFSIQDAPDNAGSIGTPATATAIDALPAPVAGDTTAIIGVNYLTDRPWLRLRATNSGTEAYTCTALVLAVPSGL